MASLFGHVVLITSVFVLPILFVTSSLPNVPMMMAFVATAAEASPSPPPPPPPTPPPSRAASEVRQPLAPSSANPNAAPIEAPPEIATEPPAPPSAGRWLGGVEGGIEGGVAGGIVGGLVAAPAPPPPPPPPPLAPPPPAPRQPVWIGGLIVAPALVRRVEPEYPAIAVAAHLEGLVILEATVDTEGRVEEVRILRSGGLLDNAALEAVARWRYAPLKLNGIPTRFMLTVTVKFALNHRTKEIG